MLRQQQVMMQQASEACAASREDEASGSTNCDVSPREFEGMSREQLIARLMVLEQEKRAGGGVTTTNRGEQSQVATSEAAVEIKSETSTNVDDDEGPSTPPDTHRSAADNNAERSSESNSKHEDGGEEDEEEEDEDGDSEQPDQVQSKPMQCLWKDCGQMLENMQKLISHISDNHVGSGKVCTCSCLLHPCTHIYSIQPTYRCEWEGCARNQKPFTKRHKMYNHLRTHTGERPFVCSKPGKYKCTFVKGM